jgi:hypothetical protein
MKIWLKQIFGLPRYFIVVYQYQLVSGPVGQGQCTAQVSGGVFYSVDEIVKTVEPNVGKIKTFLILNSIELNKIDFKFFQDNRELDSIKLI